MHESGVDQYQTGSSPTSSPRGGFVGVTSSWPWPIFHNQRGAVRVFPKLQGRRTDPDLRWLGQSREMWFQKWTPRGQTSFQVHVPSICFFVWKKYQLIPVKSVLIKTNQGNKHTTQSTQMRRFFLCGAVITGSTWPTVPKTPILLLAASKHN